MIAKLRFVACLLVLSCAGRAIAQPQYYVPQVQPKYSTLFGEGWEAITDNEFAAMAGGLLVKSGSSNARSATFLFEQCFSGGMFDELATAFGNDVRWVGGSAARHDESSWGEGDSDPYALDHWVKALQIAMQENDSMINTVNLARLLDQAGPSYSNDEHPQSIYRNGGETINHRALGASFHNAILWAGHADGERHVHDIQLMYNTIRQAYIDIGEPYTITVLGDSAELGLTAEPATKANLQAAFNALELFMNPDADFLFFASNHGGTDTYWQVEPFLVGAFTSIERRFTLSQAEIDGMLRTDEGIPEVVLSFEGLDHPGVRVFLDGIDVGDPYESQGRTGTSSLRIDRSLLSRLGSEIDIRIDNRTDFDVTLISGLFRTGGIDNVFVPEPGYATLAGCGALVLLTRARLSRARCRV